MTMLRLERSEAGIWNEARRLCEGRPHSCSAVCYILYPVATSIRNGVKGSARGLLHGTEIAYAFCYAYKGIGHVLLVFQTDSSGITNLT